MVVGSGFNWKMVAVTVCQIEKMTVFGSYLHGIFDTPKLAKLLAVNLNPQAKTMDFEEENYKEEQYNRLADLLRNSLDMKKIYQILG